MTLRRVVALAGVALYVFLWVLAVNGVTNLIAPLVVPLVLVVLIWAGLALNRFVGIAPHRPKFPSDEDEDEDQDEG
ncbi:MAG: hypothetical protein ACYDEH_08680 [Acidimicrobiales bacterium]